MENPHRIYIDRKMVFDDGVTWTTVAGLYPDAYVPEQAILDRDAEIARLTAALAAAEARAYAPKSSADTSDLRKELQQLLNELRVKAKSPRLNDDALDPVDEGGTRGASDSRGSGSSGESRNRTVKPDELNFNPAGAKRASISKNMEQPPEFILLTDEDEISEKEISGKVARYVRETNQLFINMTYSAFDDVAEHLKLRYAAYDDPELVRELAKQWAEKIVLGRVGYCVVYAQAKQLARTWTSDDVKKALEPECLSVHADGWRDAVSSAYHSISRRLGMSQAKSKADESEVPA